MTRESATTRVQEGEAKSPLRAAYRHTGRAHDRLSTADGISPEFAAPCIEELDAAIEDSKPLLPPRRAQSGA